MELRYVAVKKNSCLAPSQHHRDVDGMLCTIASHAQQDKVVTSHVHQAKGHDWDYVLVLHAVEGSWPFVTATTKTALDGELHSLYVAVTRAKKGVYLFEGRYQNARTRKPANPQTIFGAQFVPRASVGARLLQARIGP